METLINFSQSGENIILSHVLKDVKPDEIFWVDVGANDPINCSVTLLFSIRGGRGTNIEPQAMYRSRYERLRNRGTAISMFLPRSAKAEANWFYVAREI